MFQVKLILCLRKTSFYGHKSCLMLSRFVFSFFKQTLRVFLPDTFRSYSKHFLYNSLANNFGVLSETLHISSRLLHTPCLNPLLENCKVLTRSNLRLRIVKKIFNNFSWLRNRTILLVSIILSTKHFLIIVESTPKVSPQARKEARTNARWMVNRDSR